jgi:hypothetical protein
MNMKRSLKLATLGAVFSLSAGAVNADYTATINSISGAWSNVLPSGFTNFTISTVDGDTARIAWGTPAFGSAGQSAYEFDPASTPISAIVPDGDLFSLGTFTHQNNPITASGGSIEGAKLTVDIAGVVSNGSDESFSVTSVFQFAHNETANTEPGCCNDIVTAILNPTESTSVVIDQTEYFFSVEGFKLGVDGPTFANFSTAEGTNNEAILVGKLTSTVVPIPAAAWLFGSALIGAVGLGRRNKNKREA